MSVEDAKKFITETLQKNKNFSDIFQNTFSKFESTPTKLEYIAAKAKEFGYRFNPTELKTALEKMKSNLTLNELKKITSDGDDDKKPTDPVKNLVDKTKNFWNSLW